MYFSIDSNPRRGILGDPRIARISQGAEGRYADIKIDVAFKIVFGAPAHVDILIQMLECLIPGKKISSIEFMDKEIPGFFAIEKKTIFDLYCKTPEGDSFVVEMQLSGESFFTDRVLFYSTYPIREQLITPLEEARLVDGMKKKRPGSYKLSPVYMVSILNFRLPHADESCLREGLVSAYSIRSDKGNEEMTDALHFVYLELDRLPCTMDQPEKCKTMLQKLAYSFKYLSYLDERPSSFKEGLFRRIFEAAELANMTSAQRQQYDKEMTTAIDEVARLDYATEKGFQQGIQQGIQQGRREEKLLLARKLGAKGMGLDEIGQLTGLDTEDLKTL